MRPHAMATPAPAAAVAALSPGGDALALAAADNRLKTFDTSSGKLKLNLSAEASLPNGAGPSASGQGHLAEQFTCLVWGAASAKEGGKGKKRLMAESTLVAIGTSSGDVLAFDVGLGELKWRAKECNEGGVLSVAFCSSSGGTFFSAGEDSQVCAIDAATGAVKYHFQAGRAALNAVAVSSDQEHVLAGSSGLALWSLDDTHKCVCKFTGHPSQVKALAVSPDGRFGLSCGRGERSVVMWWLEGPHKKKEAIAAGLLDTEDAVVTVSAFPGSTADAFVVLAVTVTGEAYVWECTAGKKARMGAGELVSRIRVKGSAVTSSQGIFAAIVDGAGKGRSLLVARGSDVKPTFDRVDLARGAAEGKTVELEPAEDGLLLASTPAANCKKGKSGQQLKTEERVVSGTGASLEDVDSAVLRPALAGTDVAMRKRRVADANAMDVDGTAGSVGMTLGERVAALELGKRLDDEEDEEEQAVASTSGPIKADSLGVLLLQAIRSEDSALLERCLNVSNDTVINNTIRRLPSPASLQFLKAAVARLQARPARGALLAAWIRAVLNHHAAYLMGAPTAADTLMSLYQTVDNRLSLYRPLMTLSGRLSLLMAQAPAAGSDDTLEAAQPGRDGPLATLELSDDEDEAPRVPVENPFTMEDGASDSDEESDEGDGEEAAGSEEGWETDDELDSDED